MNASRLESERERVAAAARQLASSGLVLGTAGNVSERAGELVAVTPTGAVLADLEAADVAVVDLDGAQVEGPLKPTSELDLHLGLYRRYEAGAVVHCHPPIGTALACVIDELPVIHYQLLALGGPVRVGRYETFGSPALAQATLDALEGRVAALMSNHGAIAYGGDMTGAMANAELLEWGCELYWRAAAIGTPRALDEDARAAVVDAVTSRSYGATHEAQ
ncbi:MAG TPA: class II aldolase/adducin family protein [Solirubrobacteraceae bacterium]